MSELELRTAAPDADEDADAKGFWSTTDFQARAHARRPPFYALELCRMILRLEVSSVLEFGCNAGRNLELLGRVAAELDLDPPVRAGLDINAESVAFGKKEWGLDLRTADESAIESMDEGSWELIFTISVIDHIPHPEEALAALARAASKWLVLVEPHADHRGRVDGVRAVDGEVAVTPYSYVHDYDQLFAALGWVEVLDIPFPTGLARLGPLYRLRLLAADADIAATAEGISAESFLRAAILGLLEERQMRVEDGRTLRERIRALESDQ